MSTFKKNTKVLLNNYFGWKRNDWIYNDTECEIKHVSNEHPLNMHRPASYETTRVSEIQNIKDMENVIIASEQGKYQFSLR